MNEAPSRLAYFEWSLDFDSPDDVPDKFDLEAVAVANPAFGIRISEDYIAAEHETLDPRTRAVERPAAQVGPAGSPEALFRGTFRPNHWLAAYNMVNPPGRC